jgi:hypothetical protein
MTDVHPWPSFSEFLQFMTRFPFDLYNEQFKPIRQLCFPCAMHYDLSLNFKMLEYDVFSLMQFLDIIPYPFLAHKLAPTGGYLQGYFKDVDNIMGLKAKLFHACQMSSNMICMELYYTMASILEKWRMHRDL